MERESSKKEGRKEGRSQRCGTKRARESKRKKRYPVFHRSKPCHGSNEIRRKGMGGEREVVTILTYFRMTGLGLVSCLDASHGGYSIVTRPSLKENKNSFAVLLYGSRNLCAGQIVSDLSARRGGREAWILRKRFDRVWSRISPLISPSFVNFFINFYTTRIHVPIQLYSTSTHPSRHWNEQQQRYSTRRKKRKLLKIVVILNIFNHLAHFVQKTKEIRFSDIISVIPGQKRE